MAGGTAAAGWLPAPAASSSSSDAASAGSALAPPEEKRLRTGAGTAKGGWRCGLEVPVLAVGRSAWQPATAKAAPSAATVLPTLLPGCS
jgi:hypothetical protein